MAHLRLNIVVAIASVYSVVATMAAPAKEPVLPPFSEVQDAVESHFAESRDRGPRDLISRSEVEQALDELKKLGWDVQDREKILAQILPDQHVLVVTFRTPAGRKFMQQISGRELMFDRMDRISEVSGGSRLIQDIVRLPDGERYAKPKSGGGVPDLLDLLPKNASGQTRRIKDYHRPTGHIYTVADLLAKLADSYRAAEKLQSANGN